MNGITYVLDSPEFEHIPKLWRVRQQKVENQKRLNNFRTIYAERR